MGLQGTQGGPANSEVLTWHFLSVALSRGDPHALGLAFLSFQAPAQEEDLPVGGRWRVERAGPGRERQGQGPPFSKVGMSPKWVEGAKIGEGGGAGPLRLPGPRPRGSRLRGGGSSPGSG